MFAVLAIIGFALALILHMLGGHANLVWDFGFAGLICLAAAHLWTWPWVRGH